MPEVADSVKRLVIGRPQESERLGEKLLPVRIALPVFASDALSSVSYATQEILIVLSLGGLAFFGYAPWLAVCVAVLMVIVIASYRQTVHAYPSGGGDYEVVTTNLGARAGLVTAAALLVDYVLTVAVSISAAVANLGSVLPWSAQHQVLMAVILIAAMTMLNLRGVKESGTAFAIPTYLFIGGMFVMITWALVRLAGGASLQAESAGYTIVPEAESLTGVALVLLLMRAFASGATALTGVEAISNGVPAFRSPKSKNAARTLALLGAVAITLFLSVTALALITDVKVAENSENLIGLPAGEEQKTVITQVAAAVFGNFELGYWFIAGATAAILVLAANTAFNGFPVLGSILARDRLLPRQLHTRGDRLAFSNGIVLLSLGAAALVVAFEARVTALIQLYVIGVFLAFTLSQFGMTRHWTRLLRNERDAAARARMRRARAINTIGCAATGAVLVVALISKFSRGGWIVVVAIPLLVLLMRAINRHYQSVSRELLADADETTALPPRVHGVVLVSSLHRPTLRALSFARAARPDTLEAVTVAVDPEDTDVLLRDWERRRIPVPLRVLHSPYREVTKPAVDYVKRIRRESPRDLVVVYVPEYVVGRWWEQLLHNQSALRIKARLLFTPGVLMTSVPWQLASAEDADRPAPEPFAAELVRRAGAEDD